MAYLVKDAYASMTDEEISSFPKPDYSHINPLIVIEDPIRLNWSEIDIDDVNGNVAKYEKGIDPAHVDDLKNSFAQGLKITEDLPAVQLRDSKKISPKPYVLRYGFGRSHALMALGTAGWFVNPIMKRKSEDSDELISLTEQEWEKVCLYENEPLPKTLNSEQNIIDVFIKQIKRGEIKNTEQHIFNEIKNTLPHRKKGSLNRIVQAVYKGAGTKIKYEYYTDAKIGQWVKNHSKENYVFGGKFDEERHMFGFCAKAGSLIRTYEQAIKLKASTGFGSYVVMHVGEVSKDSPLSKKRKNIVKEYTTIRTAHAQVYGKDVEVLNVLGALPQQWDVENWKVLVNLKIPTTGYDSKVKPIIDVTPISPNIKNKIDEKLGLLPNNGFNTSELERKGLEVADRTGRLKELKYA